MNIVYNEDKTIATITPDAGYILTDYTDGADVTKYDSYEKVTCAAKQIATFKEISLEVNEALKAEKNAALSTTDKAECVSLNKGTKKDLNFVVEENEL